MFYWILYVSKYVSKEDFMKTSNYVLIEALEYANRHCITYNKKDFELGLRMLAPKAKLKEIFSLYKK